ncbi:MAG TPA: lipocalin-like domain-containing protein [Candidatus Acidoferrum sp.]|nr:lipocalin-like domain-containing protein [Candidatus Acidoferrum sp.]
MKSRLAVLVTLVLILNPLAAQYRTAVPGYRFEFPRDYFDHPGFQTEWWYYTGNLKSANGHRYGFELTFFRQAVSRDPAQAATWDVKDIYLAHLALSDLDGQKFYHTERMNRAGPGISGVSQSSGRIWNGNWQIVWEGADQRLQAIDKQFQLHLTLHPEKPPVVHGENGVSQKSEGAGHASYYVSLTRLAASGKLEFEGETVEVSGLAWMDHEFFTHQLESGQVGWDWLSLQMEDNTELMLFRIRRNDGSVDPFSAGTFVDAQGKSTHLRAADFTLQPRAENWTSPTTRATYPISWEIVIPKLEIELEAHTSLPAQELTGKTNLVPSYWEGAISLGGRRGESPLSGVGYLEMTGYDRPVKLDP